mmetsp:Transcript_24499/g.54452  ORF Transcript_24499/g.54452 Transcript_24499/m.54452 type:complete len:302 (-) Transcript_24499:515-1420(-)
MSPPKLHCVFRTGRTSANTAPSSSSIVPSLSTQPSPPPAAPIPPTSTSMREKTTEVQRSCTAFASSRVGLSTWKGTKDTLSSRGSSVSDPSSLKSTLRMVLGADTSSRLQDWICPDHNFSSAAMSSRSACSPYRLSMAPALFALPDLLSYDDCPPPAFARTVYRRSVLCKMALLPSKMTPAKRPERSRKTALKGLPWKLWACVRKSDQGERLGCRFHSLERKPEQGLNNPQLRLNSQRCSCASENLKVVPYLAENCLTTVPELLLNVSVSMSSSSSLSAFCTSSETLFSLSLALPSSPSSS